jgi:DNA-binding NtrC family response regulator
VRQLENIVRRALVLSPDCVDLAHVTAQPSGSLSPSHPLVDPASIRLVAGKTLRDQLDDVERTLVHAALEATKGNQTQAAKTLGISRFGLAKMMKRLGILDDHSASS